MEERDFYTETEETKPMKMTCPHCRTAEDYQIRWRKRMKKPNLPGRASREDQARFQKARSHMVRVDDKVGCRNQRCRRTFEIPSYQSVVLLDEAGEGGERVGGDRERGSRERGRGERNRE